MSEVLAELKKGGSKSMEISSIVAAAFGRLSPSLTCDPDTDYVLLAHFENNNAAYFDGRVTGGEIVAEWNVTRNAVRIYKPTSTTFSLNNSGQYGIFYCQIRMS